MLTIGKYVDDGPAKLDLDRLVETRLILQANSGGGKSWALRRILEQTHGKVQQLVIDVEDEFHTLREKYDYILAGRHGGDCPADPSSAPLLARRLLELGVSAILGIYELKAYERTRFVKLFLEALVNAPKDLWHPVLVVVDEAHIFCPQVGTAESAAAVIDLMTRGRKRGFCGILATQRISKLHKDAAAEANNKLIGRSALDVDMKRSADELGYSTREEQHSLRRLQPGEFLAFGPALSDEVRPVRIGPVETKHPRAGERSQPVPPPQEKVRKVLGQLADLPKEAAEEARTLKEAQGRIRDLERAIKAGPQPKAAPAPPAPKRIEVAVLKDSQIDRMLKHYERMLAEAQKHGAAMSMFWKQQVEDAEAMLGAIQAVAGMKAQPAPAALLRLAPPPRAAYAAPAPRRDSRPPNPGNGSGSLAKAERRILTALVQYPQGRTKVQVAILTGYASTGGGFNNALGALRSKGYATGSDLLRATEEGAVELGHFDPLPVGAELLEHWQRQLAKAERAILETVVSAYPQGITKEDVAAATGYEASGGGFNNALGKLRTLELIQGRGELRASPDLFG